MAQGGSGTAYEFIMDISGEDMNEVSSFSEDILEPRLEDLPQVSDVILEGITKYEVNIFFDENEMEQNNLDIIETVDLIGQINDETVLGELTDDGESTPLLWNTNFNSLEDVENIQIPSETGEISLQDIADISLETLETTSNSWKNGAKDFVLVQIARSSSASQLEMTNAVRDELAEIQKETAAEGITLNEIVAHSDFVEDSMDDVTINIIIGGIIAIAVLVLFLRNIRATVIVGLSIPTSVLITFTAIWLFDYSLNMLTLIGLGLGVGMMIDSSIVVFESIYSKKEKGLSNLQAVLEGTKEVAGAIIASILTTIVVFLPIGLVGGDEGRMMIILSVVVSISLISSLLVAFTLIPALAEKYMTLRKPKYSKEKSNIIYNWYQTILSWILRKKRRSFLVVILYLGLFISSFLLVTKIPMSIMPDMFNRYTEIVVELENGISNEEKEDLADSINEQLETIHDVEANYVLDQGDTFVTVVNMTNGDKIQQSQEEVSEEILRSLRSLRSLREHEPIRNVQLALEGGSGYPIQINTNGEEFEELETIASEISNELESASGIVEITNSMENVSHIKEIALNEEQLDDSTVTQLQVKEEIEKSLLQMPVGEMLVDDEEVEIHASLNQNENSEAYLLDLEIPTLDGKEELSNFIELKNNSVPETITHSQGERYISVLADIEGRDLGAINREVQEILSNYDAPDGYSVSVKGELEQQEDLMNDMIFVLVISLFLVYFVMAVQFNHLGHPLIVLFIIPITFTGVIIGLFITQKELNVMSGIGVIMLVGIVLNNSILLVDRTNQLRKAGHPINDALVAAGKNRMRPIFMTTITTVGGMLPLALASGMSADYQAPLATVIISGLLFATLITLILIPSIYKLISKEK
ncbi:efflux RND transporter permease subunit [Gracilibacillus sp. S3-1-1]|uniref:Efflux RND transporter permease subunit n=1 Tax=Gracilibacillus pellucidus TaxID=3095368 RepID=A0ACC6M8Y7_9BACI|nr:efflux RND transporter permease subunit [Gracilibacillus sp. S3-1-1]MDX8047232.1 efflux RND transporter permease subunit [Gracilibacillus sp. S3-1-1]